MRTKYGHLPDKLYVNYQKDLTNKIFKILPLKESDCETVDKYIESIIYELYGMQNICHSNGKLITLISLLEMIKQEDKHSVYKQKIFQCTNEIIPFLFEEGE